jgi:hypothetical protein
VDEQTTEQAAQERRAWQIYEAGEVDEQLAALPASPHEALMISKGVVPDTSYKEYVQRMMAKGAWTPAARRLEMARGRAAIEAGMESAAARLGKPPGVTLPIHELARRIVEVLTAAAEGQDLWQLTRLTHRLMYGSNANEPQMWRCTRCKQQGLVVALFGQEEGEQMPRALPCACGGQLHPVKMD